MLGEVADVKRSQNTIVPRCKWKSLVVGDVVYRKTLLPDVDKPPAGVQRVTHPGSVSFIQGSQEHRNHTSKKKSAEGRSCWSSDE